MSASDSGFTLIELMVTVAIVAILASFAVPAFEDYKLRSQIAATASEIKVIEKALLAYNAANDTYPTNRSQGVFPPELAGLLNPSIFTSPTPVGGPYDWEGPSAWGIAGISVRNSKLDTTTEWLMLDGMLDDHSLISGRFRWIPGPGNYVYVVDETP